MYQPRGWLTTSTWMGCISFGDYVFRGADAFGNVLACCIEEESFFVVVEALRKVDSLSATSSRWSRVGSQRFVWRANDVSECLAWQLMEAGVVIALRM